MSDNYCIFFFTESQYVLSGEHKKNLNKQYDDAFQNIDSILRLYERNRMSLQGPKGDMGNIGPEGEKGNKGSKGRKGSRGSTGM